MAVTAYQSKGRSHIRYINRLAHNIWEKHGYRDDMKIRAIQQALEDHVKYLKDVDRINKLIEEKDQKRSEKKPQKDPTSYWKNTTTGKWEPLVT